MFSLFAYASPSGNSGFRARGCFYPRSQGGDENGIARESINCWISHLLEWARCIKSFFRHPLKSGSSFETRVLRILRSLVSLRLRWCIFSGRERNTFPANSSRRRRQVRSLYDLERTWHLTSLSFAFAGKLSRQYFSQKKNQNYSIFYYVCELRFRVKISNREKFLFCFFRLFAKWDF